MNDVPEPASPDTGRWTRATMIVVRLALLAFLVWALVSANFAAETPVAEDGPVSGRHDRSATQPCEDLPAQLG